MAVVNPSLPGAPKPIAMMLATFCIKANNERTKGERSERTAAAENHRNGPDERGTNDYAIFGKCCSRASQARVAPCRTASGALLFASAVLFHRMVPPGPAKRL
jgi:hypothetical protein